MPRESSTPQWAEVSVVSRPAWSLNAMQHCCMPFWAVIKSELCMISVAQCLPSCKPQHGWGRCSKPPRLPLGTVGSCSDRPLQMPFILTPLGPSPSTGTMPTVAPCNTHLANKSDHIWSLLSAGTQRAALTLTAPPQLTRASCSAYK